MEKVRDRDMEGLGYEADAISRDLLEAGDEEAMAQSLRELFDAVTDSDAQVRHFDEAGLLTYDKGLVVALPSGREFQLTVKRSA